MTTPSAPSGAWGGTSAPTKTETKAVVALVLALAAWTPVVPFIGAIAALVVSRMARRDIERSGGALGGAGLCTAANWISVVHLVVVTIVFVLLLAAFLLPFSLLWVG